MGTRSAILMFFAFLLFADVPATMIYQGKLTDTYGLGVNDTLDMELSIFDVETGGITIWSMPASDVQILHGLFTVEIGPLDIPFDGQYWLEIAIEGDILSPRNRLTSSAYSFRAAIADSLAGGDHVIATRDTMIAHWDSIRGIPEDIADGDDGLVTVDWGTDIVDIPPGFADDIDDIIGTRDTMIAHWDSIRGMPEGFTDGIDNDGGDDGDWTISGENMYSGVSGNVGVGVTNPDVKMQICGDFEVITGSYYLYVENGTSSTTYPNPPCDVDNMTMNCPDTIYSAADLGPHVYDKFFAGLGFAAIKYDRVAFVNPLILGVDTTARAIDMDASVTIRGDASNHTHGSSFTSDEEHIRLTGGTSDYIMSVQDGSGRIQHYWNATTASPENLYLVNDERAWMWDLTITNDPYMEFKYAPEGTAGDPITWTTHMAFDTLGNVDVLGDVTANAFVGDGSALTGIDDDDWTIIGSDMKSNVTGIVEIASNSSSTTPNLLIHETDEDAARIRFMNDDTTTYYTISVKPDDTPASSRYTTYFYTTPIISFMGDGKVGIGTLSPSEMLDIAGKTRTTNFQMTSGSTNGYLLKSDASGNASWIDPASITTANDNDWTISGDYMYPSDPHYIGIGTEDPDAALEINFNSNSNLPQLLLSEIGADFSRIYFKNTDTTAFWAISALPADDPSYARMNFYYNADRLTIRGDGKVGIGISAPTTRLDVAGNVRADDYIEYSHDFTGDAISILRDITVREGEGDWRPVNHMSWPSDIIREYSYDANLEDIYLPDGSEYMKKDDGSTVVYGRSLNGLIAIDTRAIQQLIERTDSLQVQNARLEAQNSELQLQNSELLERIERIERLLGE